MKAMKILSNNKEEQKLLKYFVVTQLGQLHN